ncbi:MAG: WecB/TagA/CpsF family glycosyltransferase [Thermoleophilaceae bacterium]|nr:WecB/TagA/CpsF family glycosyltransferase [Thermoleophilaceae bacterium]
MLSPLDTPGASSSILGVRVARMHRDAALRAVERLYDTPGPAVVAYVNAHTLNLAHRSNALRQALNSAALVLNDGIGLAIAARMQGRRFETNLNGSDFTPEILALAAEGGWPVYLLGGRPGVAEAAALHLVERVPGLEVAGCSHGYFAEDDTRAVVERVRASGCGVLLVAMGNPHQELWLARHLPGTGARLGIGVGAFLDFAAGAVPRAPAVLNRLGCEWVYRLAQEPRRLWRRYIVGNPLFLARVARERLASLPAPALPPWRRATETRQSPREKEAPVPARSV